MTRGACVAAAIAAACGHGSGTSPDAAPTAGHVVFLEFEGQAIVASTTTDDAATNTSIVPSSGTVSPMYATDATRAQRITNIVSEITTLLAPYDIGLVTTRPSSLAYDMIVLGGSATELGVPPPPPGFPIYSMAPINCHYATPNVIAFVFDVALGDPIAQHTYAKEAIAMLAQAHGVPAAYLASDCLCTPSSPSGCGSGSGNYPTECTIDTVDVAIDPNTACGATGTTYDPDAAMLAAFGAHH